MKSVSRLRALACLVTVFGWMAFGGTLRAANAPALTGMVTSKEEPKMEGVLVSAKKEGSTIAVTVISDSQGRYSFPGERLDPGNYHLKIRAVGYDLNDPGVVKVESNKTAHVDLSLEKTKNLASQLTAAEWLMSAPGTRDEKLFSGFCIQCHSLEKVFRSKFTAETWMPVLQRMVNYSAASMFERTVFKPIKNPYLRELGPDSEVGGAIPLKAKELAQYLSTINLSSSKDGRWSYELKTLPRPKGEETRVIITEYDLPRPECQNHDAIVDRDGMVWFNDITNPYLGRLNPKTGEVKEWKTPLVKPGSPEGSRDIELDKEGNVWLGMRQQGAIGKFDRKTEKFTTWGPPPAENNIEINLASSIPAPDGTVWFKNRKKAYQVDPKTGEMTTYNTTAPEGYGSDFSSDGVLYLLDLNNHQIGEFNPKTGKSVVYPVPTPRSGPRRGRMDSQDRFWFGFYYAGEIGMFDTKTKQFKEWPVPPVPYSGCYYALLDDKGSVWCGSELTDNAYRLNPNTGKVISYMLPTLEANMQRIDVDNSTNPVTVWVGEAHQAKIAKIEPLD